MVSSIFGIFSANLGVSWSNLDERGLRIFFKWVGNQPATRLRLVGFHPSYCRTNSWPNLGGKKACHAMGSSPCEEFPESLTGGAESDEFTVHPGCLLGVLVFGRVKSSLSTRNTLRKRLVENMWYSIENKWAVRKTLVDGWLGFTGDYIIGL